MSGIFLVVWDDKKEDKSDVLRITKGGYPHVTLVYTGKHASIDALKKTAGEVLTELASKTITLTRAYVNSFSDRSGHIRHDVLIDIGEKEMIEATRVRFIKDQYKNHDKFFMRDPHVTFGIYETKEKAEECAKCLNNDIFPYVVEITGVTIN